MALLRRRRFRTDRQYQGLTRRSFATLRCGCEASPAPASEANYFEAGLFRAAPPAAPAARLDHGNQLDVVGAGNLIRIVFQILRQSEQGATVIVE
jgi:hypothetical protein